MQVCHGSCGQRIKKNSLYYLSADCSYLWCYKCYNNLPSVIIDAPTDGGESTRLLKKDLIRRKSDEEIAEAWVYDLNIIIHTYVILFNHVVFFNIFERLNAIPVATGFTKCAPCITTSTYRAEEMGPVTSSNVLCAFFKRTAKGHQVPVRRFHPAVTLLATVKAISAGVLCGEEGGEGPRIVIEHW